MRAIFIATGSELLDLAHPESNGQYATAKLLEAGILTDLKLVVRDNLDQLTWLIKKAVTRAQIVIVSGGLGPTKDDLTREAASRALKRELYFDQSIRDQLEEFFRLRAKSMPEVNNRQAFVLEGAEIIPNPLGTAPGQALQLEGCQLFLLPGPPDEFQSLFDYIFEKYLRPNSKFIIARKSLYLAGIGESEVEQQIKDFYLHRKNLQFSIVASEGVIELHLTVRNKGESAESLAAELESAAAELRQLLGNHIFSEEQGDLVAVISRLMVKNRLRLTVAESCTGGMLASELTSIAGASNFFCGGVVTYSNQLKTDLLNVSEELLKTAGAVSREVAAQMASEALKLCATDLALAITGIAGPGGATMQKPVGLVFIALATKDEVLVHKHNFSGNRQMIRRRATNYALFYLWQYLRKFETNT